MAVGDTVYLNSGSPPLKIVVLDGDKVKVEWFDGEKYQASEFPKVCVHK